MYIYFSVYYSKTLLEIIGVYKDEYGVISDITKLKVSEMVFL